MGAALNNQMLDETLETLSLYGYDEKAATDLIVKAAALADDQTESIGVVNGAECYINSRMEILGGRNMSQRHRRLASALHTYATTVLGF
jgi:hypothetical protein